MPESLGTIRQREGWFSVISEICFYLMCLTIIGMPIGLIIVFLMVR